jgi:hypothetical protein
VQPAKHRTRTCNEAPKTIHTMNSACSRRTQTAIAE